MQAPDFSIGNALTHFTKTGGPRGFLLPFMLSYAALGLVSQAVSMLMQREVYAIYIRMMIEGGDITAYTDELNRASMQANLGSLLMLPVALLFWVVFEAASQRRYMRGDGFRLRIGADEGRLAVIALVWCVLFVGFYIGLVIAMLVPLGIGFLTGGAAVAAVLTILCVLGALAVMLWLVARLSPAAALTIRDRQIRVFEAWAVTRGKGGQLFAAYLVLLIAIGLIQTIGYGLVFLIGYLMIAPQIDGGSLSAEAALAVMASPGFWGPIMAVSFGMLMIVGAAAHIFGGPAALAARTDPGWTGEEGVAGAFS